MSCKDVATPDSLSFSVDAPMFGIGDWMARMERRVDELTAWKIRAEAELAMLRPVAPSAAPSLDDSPHMRSVLAAASRISKTIKTGSQGAENDRKAG